MLLYLYTHEKHSHSRVRTVRESRSAAELLGREDLDAIVGKPLLDARHHVVKRNLAKSFQDKTPVTRVCHSFPVC